MTREQLDAIRARMEAATPGPWEAGTAVCCPDVGWVGGPRRTICPVYEGTKRTHMLDANDAEFIAHAREDVPALLMEVERLQTDVDLLKSLKHGWKVLTEKAIEEANTAYQLGAVAMREAAAQVCWQASDELADIPDMVTEQGELQVVATRIRALPILEVKP